MTTFYNSDYWAASPQERMRRAQPETLPTAGAIL